MKKLLTTLFFLTLILVTPNTVEADTSLSLVPSSTNVTTGSNFNVDININSTDLISGYDLRITYDGSSVNALNFVNGTFLSQNGRTTVPLSATIENNSIRFGAATFGSAPFATGAGPLATLTFQAIEAGSSNFSFNLTLITDENTNYVTTTSQVTNVNVVGASVSPTPSPSPTSTPIPTPTQSVNQIDVNIDPASQTVNTGEQFTIDLPISSNRPISGYDITLTYDNSILNAASFIDGGYLSSGGRTSFPIEAVINNGSIRLGGASFGTGDYATGNGTLATVTFNAVGSGSSAINIDLIILTDDNTNILNPSISNGSVTVSGNNPTITQTPIATPTSSPSPTATIAPTPTIQAGPATASFTVHLQGITARTPSPAPQNLTYKFYQGTNLVHSFTNKESTSNSQGYYTTNLSNDDSSNPLQAGNYRVCVKGKSNLQRCYPLAVDEIEPGSSCNQNIYLQPITIQTGSNTINLANDCQKLLAGDVDANNQLDVFDFAKVSSLYTDISVPVSLGTPEDVNHTGTISIADLSLIIINYPQRLILNGDE